MTSYSKQPGFTIVELLIVIVVIAILAAISIVAYGGMQQRARNASIAQSVSQWTKLLAASYATNGTVEVMKQPDSHGLCLGFRDDYPAIAGKFEEGQCYVESYASYTSTGVQGLMEATGHNINMETYVTDEGSGRLLRGIQYGLDDGEYNMWFNLFGEGQDCSRVQGAVAVFSRNGITACELHIEQILGGVPIYY